MTRTNPETCTVYSIPDEHGNFASVRVPIDPTAVMLATRSFPNGIPVGKGMELTAIPTAVVALKYASRFSYALYYGKGVDATLIGFCDTSVRGLPASKEVMKPSWMTYAIEQRLRLIDFLLEVYGYVNRKALEDYFGISTPQASHDFKSYMKCAPDNMIYDTSSKRYIRTTTFQRRWK